MREFMYLVITSLCVQYQVDAYGSGAFPAQTRRVACRTMTPKHSIPPQTGECPFKLTFSKIPTQPGETVSLTLSGGAADTFRGFMIQGRTSNDVAVGTFTHGTDSRWNCDDVGEGKSVLSHVEKTDKRSITATWTSPNTGVGEVTFYYTVVDVYSMYWVKQESIVFNIGASPSQTPTRSSIGSSTTGRYQGRNTSNGASQWLINTSFFLAIIFHVLIIP